MGTTKGYGVIRALGTIRALSDEEGPDLGLRVPTLGFNV